MEWGIAAQAVQFPLFLTDSLHGCPESSLMTLDSQLVVPRASQPRPLRFCPGRRLSDDLWSLAGRALGSFRLSSVDPGRSTGGRWSSDSFWCDSVTSLVELAGREPLGRTPSALPEGSGQVPNLAWKDFEEEVKPRSHDVFRPEAANCSSHPPPEGRWEVATVFPGEKQHSFFGVFVLGFREFWDAQRFGPCRCREFNRGRFYARHRFSPPWDPGTIDPPRREHGLNGVNTVRPGLRPLGPSASEPKRERFPERSRAISG